MKQLIYCCILLTAFAGCADHSKDQAAATKNQAKQNSPVSEVVGIGKIIPEGDIIQLSSAVNGIVEHIYKKENDSVKTGELIMELQHYVEDAQVRQLSAEINTQIEQVKADEAAIEEYQAKYDNALAQLGRLQSLFDKGAETQQAVDDAATIVKGFKSNLNRLRDNVLVSKSKLAETQGALDVSKKQREQKFIRSPIRGKLLEISTLVGSAIDNKTAFVQISPQGRTIADCEIDELFADKIADGQKAWIRNPGSLDTLATGTVYFTAGFLKRKSLFTDQAGEKEDRRVREIKVVLDKPEKLLLNERVECVIELKSTKNN